MMMSLTMSNLPFGLDSLKVAVESPLVPLALLGLTSTFLIISSLMLRAWRKEVSDLFDRLRRSSEEAQGLRSRLEEAHGNGKLMQEANRRLRVMLARKEEELSFAQNRPAAPLPAVGEPQGPLGSLAESLAVTTERLQAAAERMQLAMEVRKAALAKLVAARDVIKNALTDHEQGAASSHPTATAESGESKSHVIEIVEVGEPVDISGKKAKMNN